MLRYVVVIAVACGGLGCNSSSATTSPPPAPAKLVSPVTQPVDLPAGQKTYAMYCAPCHGVDAKGYVADHAPSLVNPTFLESAGDGYLTDSIDLGRPGTSMAAYGKASGGPLAPAEVANVVAWIRAQGPAAAAELAQPPTGGDVARGQPTFTAQCTSCHGTEQIRGPFASLSNPRFLAGASDAFIYHAIVAGRPGTQMQAWQDKLTPAQIADVIAYIRSLQHPLTVNRMPPPTGAEPLFAHPDGAPPKFVGHSEPCPPKQTCKPDPRFVAADDVKAAMDAGKKLVVVDARPASDWEVVHIAGALSMPHTELALLDRIPKDAWVVAYCACPHHLSGIVVDELQKRGYPHAFVLDEGINEWRRRNYPVVAAPGAPMPPAEPKPLPPQPSGSAH